MKTLFAILTSVLIASTAYADTIKLDIPEATLEAYSKRLGYKSGSMSEFAADKIKSYIELTASLYEAERSKKAWDDNVLNKVFVEVVQ